MKFELTHAMHDPAHCLAPGLFRSLVRGERKMQKLDITYEYGKGELLRFVGFEPLGADDMVILLGLIARAGPEGKVLSPTTDSALGRELWRRLLPRFDGTEKNGLVVHDRMSRLLAEIGLTDAGGNIRGLKASLERMASVTVLVTKDGRQASTRLLSYEFDATDGRLVVALNPRIAEAVIGERPYARIELAEVRMLKTDPARLMHQRLCGWIDPGKPREVKLDTLCGYVWPDDANPEAIKKRRQTVRRALRELENARWTVHEYAKGKFSIGRPKTERSTAASKDVCRN
jgi:hypothetical protein